MERRARSTGGGGGLWGLRRAGRSLLEAELRRVGLDEDGPEYLHVLAGARLHVLVQDVDPSLLLLRGMRADPELLERRHERLQPRHDCQLAPLLISRDLK